MSFTRLNADECAERKSLDESMAPGLYAVNTPVLCGQAFQSNNQLVSQMGSDSLNSGVDWRFYSGPVDVESDLRNINRAASRCPENKYAPNLDVCDSEAYASSGYPAGGGVVGGSDQGSVGNGMYGPASGMRKTGQRCGDNNLVDFPDAYMPAGEQTRLSNPANNVRSVGWNRFECLALNPQDRILMEMPTEIPSRLVIKDNHRPCVPDTSAMFAPLLGSDAATRVLPTVPTVAVPASYVASSYAYDRCG